MVAVARVLPWERSLEDDSVVRPVIDSYQERWPDSSPDLITLAYDAANAAHEGQRRKSGEPYIYHPVAVATVVADLGLDDATIAAALLHDAVEDTNFSLDEVRREFGDDVAAMVDGVTKLDRLRFETKQAQEAATMRKMLVAMAKDLRVLLIKLSDRLHNMRTPRRPVFDQTGAHRPRDSRHIRPASAPSRHARHAASSSRTSRSRRCTRSDSPKSTGSSPLVRQSDEQPATTCSKRCGHASSK